MFDLMPEALSDFSTYAKYVNYLLSTYISSDSRFPPKFLRILEGLTMQQKFFIATTMRCSIR